MKINRLIEIITILLNRQTVTARELAERFDVSRRTIYRDIEVLSSAGVPIYSDKGKGGGISILEDYTLNKALLSKSESDGLILALKAMASTDYPEADSLLDKVSAIFKNSRANDWIEIDLDSWNNKVNEDNKFTKIRDAIRDSTVIYFDYINGKGVKSSRLVEPIKLMFNAYTWYLIAYCYFRCEQRMFRLSRIRNIELLDQHFTKRTVAEQEKPVVRAPLVELKLRCDAKVLNRLYDAFDEQYIIQNNDGSFDLIVQIPDEEWVFGFILSFGNHVEVIEPEHIRLEIKNRAKKIYEQYL
ncbi:MAG: YafY family transcriptional regulator [Coriobacteriales bacterium]|jgi:predicted DNA-binding transcriptional regulator YafY|nr:YafY family transcriptional regulator [Coriobacteriales bacterium]